MKATPILYKIDCSNISRWDDDRWHEIEPKYIKFWETEAELFGIRTYEHNGRTVNVCVDWQPIGNEIARQYDILKPVRKGTTADPDWFEKLKNPFNVDAEVSFQGRNELSKHPWYPDFFLELYLYEFFFVANLAVPGVAQFFSLSFKSANNKKSVRPKLSSLNFDHAWMNSLEGNWPFVCQLPFSDVITWYKGVSTGIKQQADTGTERAIFVVYHLCRIDLEVESILWVFHGLEALLSTRVGENVSGMVRRASMLLEPNEKQKKLLNKSLRHLYKIRSPFVHGGYPVAHPMSHEIMDRRLDDVHREIIRNSEFGFFLLISIIQKMIVLGVREIRFEETLVLSEDAP